MLHLTDTKGSGWAPGEGLEPLDSRNSCQEPAFLGFTSIVFLLTTAIVMVWDMGAERLVPRWRHCLGTRGDEA